MPDDLRRLELALINADKAGDVVAAKALADHIRSLGGLQVPDGVADVEDVPRSAESQARIEQKELEETGVGRFQVAATEPFEDLQGKFEGLLKATGLENVPADRQRNFIEKLPKQLGQSLAGVATIGLSTLESGLNVIGQGIEELTGVPREDSTEFMEIATLALGNPSAIKRIKGVPSKRQAPGEVAIEDARVIEQPARPQLEAPALEGQVLPREAPIIERVGQRTGETFTRLNEKIDRVFPPEEKAQSTLRDMLRLDKIEPTNIRQLTKDFEARNGRTPTLLEIGGENVEALARKAGGEIGEGRAVIEKFRNTVLEGQTRLVKDIAERTLVQPNRSFLDDVTALETQMKRQAQPLYDEAFKQSIKVTDDIKSMINTPAGKNALKKAVNLIRQEGKDPAAMGIIKDKKKLTLADDVGVEALDSIKRGFDDIIESSRDKTTGKLVLDQMGRATNKTRADFRSAVDELSPVYKEARDAFAGPATLKNALLDARNAAKKPAVTADQIAARMKDMTASEKEFYRSGFMRGIMDIMEGGITDVNRVRALVKSEKLVGKLEVIFDNKEMAKQFVDQLREAEKLSKRVQVVSPSTGSQTALRQADIESIGAIQNKGDVLRNVVKAGYDKMRQNRNIRNEQLINKDIAELLTQPLTDDVLEQIAKRLQENK
jgi:hypothetical protein